MSKDLSGVLEKEAELTAQHPLIVPALFDRYFAKKENTAFEEIEDLSPEESYKLEKKSKLDRIIKIEKDIVKADFKELLTQGLDSDKKAALSDKIDEVSSKEGLADILADIDLKTFRQIDRSYLHVDRKTTPHITPPPSLEFEGNLLAASNKEVLQSYINDNDLSVVASLSQGDSLTCEVGKEDMNTKDVFNIQSVGKIMTGVLAIKMLQDGVLIKENLDKKVELDPEVLEMLPQSVQGRLNGEKAATLSQLMTHKSGLGDYFIDYVAEIDSAVKDKRDIPIIEKPEDLLKFADREVKDIPEGEIRYSNLAILIVGLAIQKEYNKKYPSDTPLSFDEILKKHVLVPAGVTQFSKHSTDVDLPEGAGICVDDRDRTAIHLAGAPDGGQWSDLESLNNFGKWFCKEWNTPKVGEADSFKELVTKYGKEFYQPEHNLVEHNGTSPSSNAYLSIFPETNTVFVALSNRRLDANALHDLVMPQIKERCSAVSESVDNSVSTDDVVIEKSFAESFPSKKCGDIKKISEAEDLGEVKKSWQERVYADRSKDDSFTR